MTTLLRFAKVWFRRSSRNTFDVLSARNGDRPTPYRRVAVLLVLIIGLSALATGYDALAASLPHFGPDRGPENAQVWPGENSGPDTAFSVRVPMLTVENPQSIVAAAGLTDTIVVDQETRANTVRGLLSGKPLAAYSLQMVRAADANGVDWRLIPVISILESGGGTAACGGNAWGFAACRVTFGSFEEGISRVAATLAASPYAGESPEMVLCTWVSGGNCGSALAYAYLQQASGLFAQLGGRALQVGAPPPPEATPSPTPAETPATAQGTTPTSEASATPADPAPVPKDTIGSPTSARTPTAMPTASASATP
ncbi:MAG: hypothetical protein ABI305_06435 [Tepidiformaceae bacterium]